MSRSTPSSKRPLLPAITVTPTSKDDGRLLKKGANAKAPKAKSFMALTTSPNPVISKMLDDKNRQSHLSRLALMKSNVDNRPPKTFAHLVNRPKTVQMENGAHH